MHGKLFRVLLLIALLHSASIIHACSSSDANSATEAIDRARRSLVDAYMSVLDAEKEGADIASLTKRLTEAGSNLTDAYLLFDAGSYDAALALAEDSYETGKKIEAEATELEAFAHVDAKILFSIRMIGYVGTLAIIVLASVLGWKTCKERYYRRVMEMKPEATNTES